MVKESPELEYFIAGKSLEFILSFDDSGKASIDICCEKDAKVKWISNIN